MSIQLTNPSGQSIQIGDLVLPDSDWSIAIEFSPSSNRTAYNHLFSNGNAGQNVPDSINILYTTDGALAINFYAPSGELFDIDSGTLEGTNDVNLMAWDEWYLLVLIRTGNLLQFWKLDYDSAGNTPRKKIYEVDCEDLGAITLSNCFLGVRDGAYASSQGRGNFGSFGYAPVALTETQMNQIATGSALTGIGVTWEVGFDSADESGSVTAVSNIGDNGATINPLGSLIYAANPTYAPALSLGWRSPQLLDRSDLPEDAVSDLELIFWSNMKNTTPLLVLESQDLIDGYVTIASTDIGALGDAVTVNVHSPSLGFDLTLRNTPVANVNA